MNDFADDDFTEPTEDVRSARRALTLAIALINSRHPITTERIRREFYDSLSDAAFRKAFQRDRTRLASAGIVVEQSKFPTGAVAWSIDESNSFVRENSLTPEDTLTLSLLLVPLASDPSFPYANDLRMALTKIDRSFERPRSAHVSPHVRARSTQLTRIETCMAHHHAARITYTRADGSHTQRTIVPLGMFSLHESTYLVAAKLVDSQLEPPHVYNIKRMDSVTEVKRGHYPIPPDFDVRDYISLPFQLGAPRYEALLRVPEERVKDVASHVRERGTWVREIGDDVLRVSVSDEEVAASWTIAEGAMPLAPSSLVNTWKRHIEQFCSEVGP